MQVIGGPGFPLEPSMPCTCFLVGVSPSEEGNALEITATKRLCPNHVGSSLNIRKVICTTHLVQAVGRPIALRNPFSKRDLMELASSSALSPSFLRFSPE